MRLTDSGEQCPCEGYFQSSGSRLLAALFFEAETGWGEEANEGDEHVRKKERDGSVNVKERPKVATWSLRLHAFGSVPKVTGAFIQNTRTQLQEHIKCFG